MAFRNLESEAEMINSMAKLRFHQRDFIKAIDLYRQSIGLMEQANNQDKVAIFQKEFEAALFGQAQKINNDGDRLFSQGNYIESVVIYKEAWNLVQQAGEPYISKVREEFTSELKKAKIALAKNVFQANAEKMAKESKWEFAIGLYFQVLSMFKSEEDKEIYDQFMKGKNKIYSRWAQETNKDGDKHYKKAEFQNAIEIYVRSIQLVEKSKDIKLMKTFMKTLTMAFSKHAGEIKKVGDKLMKQNKFKEASEFYSQSVKIAEGAGNNKLVGSITKELARSLEKYAQSMYEKGDDLMIDNEYEKAAGVYLESLELARETENIKLIVEFEKSYHQALEGWAQEVNFKGKLKFNDENWEEASKHFSQSLLIITKTNNQKMIEECRNELHNTYLEMAKKVVKYGDLVFEKGEFQKAYDYYDYSVKMAELAGNQMYAQNYMLERNRAMKRLNTESKPNTPKTGPPGLKPP